MTRVIAVDFDGTLVPFNSFPKWVRHLIQRGSFHSPGAALSAISLLAARKARLISHTQFKAHLCRIAGSLDPLNSFGSLLNKQVDWTRLLPIIKRIHAQSEACVCVCSAAPAYYLKAIECTVPFDGAHVLGSRWESGRFVDNFGDNKIRSLIERLGPECNLVATFTDHHDDIPLLRVAKEAYLVKPDRGTISSCMSAGIAFKILS